MVEGDMGDWSLSLSQDFSAEQGDVLSFDYCTEIDSHFGGEGHAHAACFIEVYNHSTGWYDDLECDWYASWTSISHTITEAGEYTLIFSVHAMAEMHPPGGPDDPWDDPDPPPEYPPPGEESWAGARIGIDNVQLALVPEPSTLLLLSVAALAVLAYAWRRR